MSHGTTLPQPNNNTSKDPIDNGHSKSFNVSSFVKLFILFLFLTLKLQNETENILGCKHYQRKCKLEANCCQKIVTCRFCHDDAEDHTIVR